MIARRPTRTRSRSRWLWILSLAAWAALAAAGPAWAQDTVTIRGEVGQTLGFALEDGPETGDGKEPLWTAGQVGVNRTHYRLEFERRFGYDAAGFIALKGHFDASAGILEELAGEADEPIPSLVELDQAYVDLYSDSTDFRLGRQKIAWGTADGLNPTSYFAPLTLDLTGGLSGLVQPVTALRSATYFNVGTLSAVVVPTFEPRPEEEIRSALDRIKAAPLEGGGSGSGGGDLAGFPRNRGEIGFQFDTFFRGSSLYLSYFNGYEDQPAAWEEEGETRTEWRRQQTVGLAAATTWRGLTLWGEATYTLPGSIDHLVPEEIGPDALLSPTEPYVQAVVGGDYRLPSGMHVELQYAFTGAGSLLMPYRPADSAPGQYLMVLASCPLGEAHALELLVLDGLQDDSVVGMPTYRYKITPTTEASLGLVVVGGSEGSEFARAGISRADQAVLAVTVRF